MTTTERLILALAGRGVLLEPEGDGLLAVEPVALLSATELEELRDSKPAILDLFASGRLAVQGCPGEGCGEVLTIFDGLGYCKTHDMNIRFIGGLQ